MNLCLYYFALTFGWYMYTVIYMYFNYVVSINGETFVNMALVFLLAQKAILTKLYQVYEWIVFCFVFLVRKFIGLFKTQERRRIHLIRNGRLRGRTIINNLPPRERENNVPIDQHNSNHLIRSGTHRRESLEREIASLDQEIIEETSVIRRRHLEGRRNRLMDDLNRMI